MSYLNELAFAQVTVYGLCGAIGQNPMRLLCEEAVRVMSMDQELLRAKHAAKVAAGTAG